MHGPWHMPEHPDERDNSEQERAMEAAEREDALVRERERSDALAAALRAVLPYVKTTTRYWASDTGWATEPNLEARAALTAAENLLADLEP